MEKEGKVDLLSIIILSIVIFLVYVVLVLANLNMGGGVEATFPENNTNASATFGYSPSAGNASFNALTPQFHCTARANTTVGNVTNVSLYIGTAPGGWGDLIENQTVNVSIDAGEESVVIINVTSAFNEGVHWWFCRSTDNGSGVAGTGTANYNTTLNRTFTIDKTGPYLTTNVTNTSNAAVSTEDVVYFAVNFTDQYTSIHTVRLFVNASGAANNEVNITADSSGSLVQAGNDTMVNLSYTIPGHLLDDVLNFTLWVNDSVNNVNMSPAVVLRVDRDATGPGFVNLSSPIDGFNQSTGTVSFNFTAMDNNNSAGYEFTCGINISLTSSAGNSAVANITNIEVTNGTSQANSTSDISVSLSNGTYMWNVSCTDNAGNINTSLSQNFTVDQIAPVLVNFTINGTGTNEIYPLGGYSGNPPDSGRGSWAQGRQLTAFGNFTDNLTKLLEADLQFYNTSLGDWQTINTTKDDSANIITSATSVESLFNLSFTPPSGRNEFEGKNVSFRLLVNDTLGNMNISVEVVNITISINDTYAPTITINSSADGAAMVNGSNISDTTPRISWAVDENNDLQSINISFDNTHIGQTGSGLNVDGCNKYAFFTSTQSSQVKNPEYFRNGSFTVTDDQAGGCPTLTNGSHSIIVTAIDVWGNELVEFHNFSIQSGSIPGLAFVNLTTPTTLWSKDNDNNSNITSLIGLGIGGVSNGGLTGENIQSLTYTSSCDSTEITFINNTVIYPFNRSSACKTESENRTVTITVTDTAGNFNTIVLGFLVDNVGPSFSSIESPTDGQTFVNAKTALNFTMLDYDQAISSFGYYLDGSDGLVTMNISAAIGSAGTSITENNLTNFTSGTHTIKFTVNDTLGNARNSSVITFTQVGLIRPNEVNSSINEYLLSINPGIAAINTSVRSKGADGVYIESNETAVNDTFEIFLNLNASSDTHNMNVTITEINGSGANWGKINFSVFINDTKFENSIQNNFTMNLLTPFVLFNGSIDEFLSNENDYYGVIVLPYNVSKNGTGTAQEIWYFEDENDLTARTNVSQCTTSTVYSRTSTSLPCWNYTSGGRTIVTVPHFSGAGAVNDTGSPSVSINSPATSLGISEVIPNVTVSNDATDCKYIINGTDSSVSSNISSATLGTIGNDNICTWSEIRFKDGVYNITFNVTDASGNLNLSVNRTFTMADSTAPNSGTSISSSPGETSATVTISGVNESVNATVFYGTGNTSFTNSFMQTAFSKSPSVSFTGLTASTVYYYNVTLYDYNGNSVFNSTVFTFTTDAASTTTTTTTTTTTSSGGGGGAATVSKVADSKAQVWSTVPAGSSFSLDVDKATIAVTSVAVNDVKSELKNVDLEVQALKENPLSTEAAAKVYQYLRINKKNIVDSDAEGFKVSFRVTKAWLTENSLASGDISLYRYKSGWNELVTKVTGTDSTYVNYEADTPGFSSFAVGTKTGVVVEEEVPEGEEVAPGEEAPGEVAPPEEVEAPKAIEAPGKAPVAWLIAAVVIILGIILIVAYQKKKQQV